MALMLPHSIFFHIPKTGGMWVRRAIRNAGIPTVELPRDREPWNIYCNFRFVAVGEKFTFTFVRNPLSWHPSFWDHRMRTGWRTEDVLDSCRSDDFELFMWKVLQRFPGHLGRRFETYVGPRLGILDFLGKQENLAEDLITALKLAGEEFDEQKIRNTPCHNESDLRPAYSPKLLRAVLESERKTMVRFGYFCPIKITHPSPGWSESMGLGTSMLPFFKSGETVLSQPIDPAEIRRGDIVTFWVDSFNWATHRVVQIIRRGGLLAFRTKGDNRSSLDSVVLPSQIVGKVLCVGRKDLTQSRWQFLGKIIAFFSYFQGRLFIRLSQSRINRIRNGLARRGLFPKLRLREGFNRLTNPFAWMKEWIRMTEQSKAWQDSRRLTGQGIHLQTWKSSDIHEMTRVWNEAFPGYPTTTERLSRRICKSPWFNPSGCLVLKKNGRLLGWALAGSRNGHLSQRTDVGYLELIAVTQEGKNLGLEKFLVRETTSWLDKHSAPQIVTGPFPVENNFIGFNSSETMANLASEGFMPAVTLQEMKLTKLSYRTKLLVFKKEIPIRPFRPEDEIPLREFFLRNQSKGVWESSSDYLKEGGNSANLLVSVRGKGPVGFLRLLLDSQIRDVSQCRWIWSATQPLTTRGYLFSLMVDKNHRSRGIGTALTARAVESLFQKGCEAIYLQALRTDLYERLGFIQTGQFVILNRMLEGD